MHRLLPCLLILFAAPALRAQSTDEQAIHRLLDRQVAAWNTGDISAYMAAGYWQSDSLVFIGKSGPRYGYAQTLAGYRKSYPDTAAMGRLGFEVLSLKRLSPDYYFAVGKWMLQRSAGNIGGSWTLLFRKIKGQWKIIADHSS